jgi:tRNA(Ile)-lysidine synthase
MRARVRHQLMPLLLQDFDSAAVTRLARLAGHAREDEAFWRSLENSRFQALATRESPNEISLGIDDLLSPMKVSAFPSLLDSQPPHPAMALSRRLVRKIYAELRGTREQLTSRHVESVIELATKSQSGARINLPGISVERIFDRLVFKNAIAVVDSMRQGESLEQNHSFAYTVSKPERLDSASVVVTEIHRRFNLKIVDWPPSTRDTVSGGIALDFERVQWPLVLRNWLPGDSYRPQGSRSARKVKRLLLESRIPRGSRVSWPILTSQGKVIWASGYPVAEELAADEGTKSGLIIAEENL